MKGVKETRATMQDILQGGKTSQRPRQSAALKAHNYLMNESESNRTEKVLFHHGFAAVGERILATRLFSFDFIFLFLFLYFRLVFSQVFYFVKMNINLRFGL